MSIQKWLSNALLVTALFLVASAISGCKWLESDDEEYVPIAISATISPAPNADGWNNTDVTVNFQCSGSYATCSAPVLLQLEGAGQVASGSVTDSRGGMETVTVTVNVDKTPPQLAVASPIPDLYIEYPSTPSVHVAGTVGDSLSDLSSVDYALGGAGSAVNWSSGQFSFDVDLNEGQNSVVVTASDLAGNLAEVTAMMTYSVPQLHAIVDVVVTNGDLEEDYDDYTGLRFFEATEPYIPGEVGERRDPHIAYRYCPNLGNQVWVKWDSVAADSNETDVLVEYTLTTSQTCPDGWVSASGLRFGDSGSCNDVGQLCARYAPMSEVDSFITAVGLNWTKPARRELSVETSKDNCAPFGEGNGGYWPMHSTNEYDGALWLNFENYDLMTLCYAEREPSPPMPTTVDISDEEKLRLLESYAPLVYLENKERFFPSSVEMAFDYSRRVLCYEHSIAWHHCGDNDLTGMPDGSPPSPDLGELVYWLVPDFSTIAGGMPEADSILDYFNGCNEGNSTILGMPCGLSDVPVYAFWVEKTDPYLDFEYVDLIYFFYYPYNRGKWISLAKITAGNHVGDWEHVSVRLHWSYESDEGWTLKPVQIYLQSHGFGAIYKWTDIPTYFDESTQIQTDHPIVYSANHSHGNWPRAATWNYRYVGFPIFQWLTDYTSQGAPWYTWDKVQAFDYDLRRTLGDDDSWPLWLSADYACRSSDPCGAIYRWGPPRETHIGAGYYELERGPTGPEQKGVWDHGPLR